MRIPTKIDTLLEVIERRLAEISERQHALAVERARLVEQRTLLRLGVASPDLARAQLRSKGIVLRRAAGARTSYRRTSETLLKSVVKLRKSVTMRAAARSETA